MFLSQREQKAATWGVQKEVKKRFSSATGEELEPEVLYKVLNCSGDLVATFFENLQPDAKENAQVTALAPEMLEALDKAYQALCGVLMLIEDCDKARKEKAEAVTLEAREQIKALLLKASGK